MDYNYDGLAALGVALLIVFFGLLIAVVIDVIGKWKVLKKGGEEGWKSLIPVYNEYVLFQMVGLNPIWVLIKWASIILVAFVKPLGIVSTAVGIYTGILFCVSISNAFGKSTLFAIGTYFFQPIAMLILGFGSSEFQGKRPMEDPIMNMFNGNSSNNNTTPNANVVNATPAAQAGATFCTNCGAPINDGSAFCTSCGNKIN